MDSILESTTYVSLNTGNSVKWAVNRFAPSQSWSRHSCGVNTLPVTQTGSSQILEWKYVELIYKNKLAPWLHEWVVSVSCSRVCLWGVLWSVERVHPLVVTTGSGVLVVTGVLGRCEQGNHATIWGPHQLTLREKRGEGEEGFSI